MGGAGDGQAVGSGIGVEVFDSVFFVGDDGDSDVRHVAHQIEQIGAVHLVDGVGDDDDMGGEGFGSCHACLVDGGVALGLQEVLKVLCFSGEGGEAFLTLIGAVGGDAVSRESVEEGVVKAEQAQVQAFCPRVEQQFSGDGANDLVDGVDLAGALEGVMQLQGANVFEVEHQSCTLGVITDSDEGRVGCGNVQRFAGVQGPEGQVPQVGVHGALEGGGQVRDVLLEVEVRLGGVKCQVLQDRDGGFGVAAVLCQQAQAVINLSQGRYCCFGFKSGQGGGSFGGELDGLARLAAAALVPAAGSKDREQASGQQRSTGEGERVVVLLIFSGGYGSVLGAAGSLHVVGLRAAALVGFGCLLGDAGLLGRFGSDSAAGDCGGSTLLSSKSRSLCRVLCCCR